MSTVAKKEKMSVRHMLVVLTGIMITFGCSALCFSTWGLFQPVVAEGLGVETTAFAMYVTVMYLTMTVASPFMGKLLQTVDIRIILSVSACLVGGAFLLMSVSNEIWMFYLAAVLLGQEPVVMTGRGAGLSDAGLQKKIHAIETAVAVNRPDPADVLDVLHKVGGLDIAGLAGVFLGGALCHTPVLVDGFISSVAALVAARLCPACKDYMLGSHASEEPASRLVLSELGLRPFLYAGMRLGEGTGAVAVMPLLDMGLAVYREMATFEDTNIEAYQPLG